jgi:uncharacterized coiled-coil DUF342 family protein
LGRQAISQFGNTPANNLANSGIPYDKQYDDYLNHLKDKAKYFEDKINEELKDKKDRRDELIEENKKLLAKLESISDPQEKAKVLEAISDNKKEISQINKEISDYMNKITKNFEALGQQHLTQEQFKAKTNAPNLSSFKN